MRHYEHFTQEPYGILLADPKSAKGHWGLNQPEYLDEDNPHFLRKGHTTFPHSAVVYQLTEASEPIGEYQGRPFGQGFVVVEEEQYDGTFTECGIHESKVVWEG